MPRNPALAVDPWREYMRLRDVTERAWKYWSECRYPPQEILKEMEKILSYRPDR